MKVSSQSLLDFYDQWNSKQHNLNNGSYRKVSCCCYWVKCILSAVVVAVTMLLLSVVPFGTIDGSHRMWNQPDGEDCRSAYLALIGLLHVWPCHLSAKGAGWVPLAKATLWATAATPPVLCSAGGTRQLSTPWWSVAVVLLPVNRWAPGGIYVWAHLNKVCCSFWAKEQTPGPTLS